MMLKNFWAEIKREYVVFFLLLISCGIVLVRHFAAVEYPIGHDIFFHLHAADKIAELGLRLPLVLPHYWGDFLFGYPPLFHATMAALHLVFGIPLAEIFKISAIMMPLICISLVYILYLLYRPQNALVSVCVYILLIFDLLWPIYSGEYPRLFSSNLALLGFVLLTFYKRSGNFFLAIASSLLLGLAMMSNMIAAIFILPLLFYETSESLLTKNDLKIIVMPIIALLVSAVWWLRAMYLYGIDYFYYVLTINQKADSTIVVGLIATIIFGIYVLRKKTIPSIFAPWLILSLATQGTPFQGIPIAYYLVEILSSIKKRYQFLSFPNGKIILALVTIIVFWAATSGKYIYNDTYMNPSVFEAAQWLRTHTPPNASVMAFGSARLTSSDTINTNADRIAGTYRDEIIPYYADRLTYTWFGYEWSNDEARKNIYADFHDSLCVDDFVIDALEHTVFPNYLWINTTSPDLMDPEYYCDDLNQEGIDKVFENEEAAIFELNWDLLLVR